MSISFLPVSGAGHTATPAAQSYTVEGSGAPARLTHAGDYPVVAICKICRGRIRLGHMMQLEWQHAPLKPSVPGGRVMMTAAAKLLGSTPPFAALLTAPAMARAHSRVVLYGWGLAAVADDAQTVVGELVANAVEAYGDDDGIIRMCLLADGDVLTVEVWDQAPGLPLLKNGDGLSEDGRGLLLVDALTNGCWGCQPAVGQHGKCTWAELRLSEPGSLRCLPLRRACRGGARDQGQEA